MVEKKVNFCRGKNVSSGEEAKGVRRGAGDRGEWGVGVVADGIEGAEGGAGGARQAETG